MLAVYQWIRNHVNYIYCSEHTRYIFSFLLLLTQINRFYINLHFIRRTAIYDCLITDRTTKLVKGIKKYNEKIKITFVFYEISQNFIFSDESDSILYSIVSGLRRIIIESHEQKWKNSFGTYMIFFVWDCIRIGFSWKIHSGIRPGFGAVFLGTCNPTVPWMWIAISLK